jgi:hypothetical protein
MPGSVIADMEISMEIDRLDKFMRFLTEHMSILFDGANYRTDVGEKLAQRMATLSPGVVGVWKAKFDTLVGAKVGDVFVAAVLLPVDDLFDGNDYNNSKAEKFVRRLGSLSPRDIDAWMKHVERGRGTRLDAAVSIVRLEAFFNGSEFNRSLYDRSLAALD